MRMPTYEELSEEQDVVYLSAPMDGAVLVTGPPGTGKTVMAFYRAQSAIGQKKAAKVVMFNSVLKKYTEGSFPDKNVAASVTTWHSWFEGWWLENFFDRSPKRDGNIYDHDWDVISRRLVERAANGYKSWGHVVLDEGQDFPKSFYDASNLIMNLSGEGANALTVFADDNQRLTRNRNSTISEIRDALYINSEREYQLTRNYRNTLQIAKLAAFFYVGLQTGIPKLPEGRNGQKPVVLKCQDLNASMDYITRFANNNNDLSIGVFTKDQNIQKTIYNKLSHRLEGKGLKVQRYTSGEKSVHGKSSNLAFDRNGTVTVLCFQSCKGLEFDAVFIPEIQDFRLDAAEIDVLKMQMYVMVSRARTHLHLMYSDCEKDTHPVLKLLPPAEAGILEYRHDN